MVETIGLFDVELFVHYLKHIILYQTYNYNDQYTPRSNILVLAYKSKPLIQSMPALAPSADAAI